ncbi:hypothetical protein [Actinophytocola sp.]|uniref:hypothetical protein n=1 Tax=Actinophytocola sp. TaxID=1872138 RepID=UPI00389B0893
MEPHETGGWYEPHPESPAPPNGGRAVAVVAGVVGVVVGAGLASGAWLLFGGDGGGGSSAAVSAPARLGDYYRYPDLQKVRERNGQSGDMTKLVDHQATWDKESSARLSASRDGAGAVVQQYANEELESMFSLEVVRSPSASPQYVAYSDPGYLGVDKPPEEMVEFGPVSCVVRNDTTGQTFVVNCQRTSAELTVTVTHANGDLGGNPRAVADVVNEAWSQLG